MKFYQYPKCSTCKSVLNKIKDKYSDLELIDIKENNPDINTIKMIHERSGLDINKLFNTSGNKYKELNLKEKLASLSLEEKYALLASDGMLVKRPILILEDKVVIGSRDKFYE